MPKIYCAGPLFNNKEQEEMAEISNILENKGFKTFLPQRDGIELSKLFDHIYSIISSLEKAKKILEKAIFSLDIYHLLNSDAVVLNMNGRVPDEGAVVEAGVAWSAGIPLVIFKNDKRTLINGTDNPMILGLSNFEIVTNINDIPTKINREIKKIKINKNQIIPCKKTMLIGEKISEILLDRNDNYLIASNLINVFNDDFSIEINNYESRRV